MISAGKIISLLKKIVFNFLTVPLVNLDFPEIEKSISYTTTHNDNVGSHS